MKDPIKNFIKKTVFFKKKKKKKKKKKGGKKWKKDTFAVSVSLKPIANLLIIGLSQKFKLRKKFALKSLIN